jgi:ABC-type proline/glycine betaine transport system permease subunit
MNTFDQSVLAALILAVLVGWMLYRQIRAMPGLFSSEVLWRASHSLALLALFLMVVVGFFFVTM